MRLTEEGRVIAAGIFKVLSDMKQSWKTYSPQELTERSINILDDLGVKTEYLRLADEIDFSPVKQWKDSDLPRAFFAGYVDGVRLIDNMAIGQRQPQNATGNQRTSDFETQINEA